MNSYVSPVDSINEETKIVELIISVDGETREPVDGYYEIEILKHDPSFFGMKYEDGKFIKI